MSTNRLGDEYDPSEYAEAPEEIIRDKDDEIEGLKARVEALRQIREEDKALITELCDALEESASHDKDWARQSNYLEIAHRAREAT